MHYPADAQKMHRVVAPLLFTPRQGEPLYSSFVMSHYYNLILEMDDNSYLILIQVLT